MPRRLIRKADENHQKGSKRIPEIYVTNCTPTENAVGNVLRAGCDSPPAVMARNASSPRALAASLPSMQGQQTRCDPGADGIVRMKRERDWHNRIVLRRVQALGVADGFARTLASHSIQNALFFY